MEQFILYIEHPITDLRTWRTAFDRFADVRREAGVRTEAVSQPVDDDQFVVIQLGFDDAAAARTFLDFLEQTVWSTSESSPALAGKPVTRILRSVSLDGREASARGTRIAPTH